MTARIDIPRLDDESPRAYEARVAYITAGAGRSIEKTRQKTGKKPATIRTLERWSIRYQWVDGARQYDDTLASLAAQDAAAAYRAELEEYRQRYQKTGRDLHQVATAMLAQLGRAVYGQVIEAKDGNKYTIPALEFTPASLTQVARAMLVAGDLEAHALRISELLPRLTSDDQLDQE